MTATILKIQAAEQKAAEAIERYAANAIAKINDNAGALFSRYMDANNRATALANEAEKKVSHLHRVADGCKADVDGVAKESRKFKQSIAGFAEQLEDIAARLTDARFRVNGVTDMVGKRVRIKSGGHIMTATGLADDGGVLCFWASSDGDVLRESIPVAALEIVDESGQ